MTPLTKAARLAIGGAVAPVVRRQAAAPRRVTLVDKAGNVTGQTTSVEVAKSLLARAEIEFSVQEGKRPEWVKCKLCGKPFRLVGRGRPIYCPGGCIGATFAHWTVTGVSQSRSAWVCRCRCGSIKTVLVGSLVTGKSKSCGCVKSSAAQGRNACRASARIGQRHGALVVCSVERRDARAWLMVCQCDCGETWKGEYTHLRTGRVTSCGCGEVARQKSDDMHRARVLKSVAAVLGRRFGKLVVIRAATVRPGGVAKQRFVCHCDCGKECTRSYMSLCNTQTVSSCGCYLAEVRRRRAA